MNKIIVFGHLLHRDYPWSVGKLRRLKVFPLTDDGMESADKLVQKIRSRTDFKRLRSFWRTFV